MPLYQTIDEFEPIRLMMQVEATTDENLRAYLHEATLEHQRLCAAGTRYIAVLDASIGIRLTPLQRKMYADWMREVDPLLRQCLAGAAFVMPNPLVRGALTAILWVVPLSAPYTVHKSLDEALRWAIDLAREADLPLSPELQRRGAAAFESRAAVVA